MRITPILLAGVLSLAACVPPPPVAAGPGPNPYPPVPAAKQEPIPPPPVSEQQLVWRFGDWEWVGTGYVWQPGDYEPIAGHTNLYLPGHWSAESGAWAWVRGHWM
jgi:WXXGXW repeat (2 copies)